MEVLGRLRIIVPGRDEEARSLTRREHDQRGKGVQGSKFGRTEKRRREGPTSLGIGTRGERCKRTKRGKGFTCIQKGPAVGQGRDRAEDGRSQRASGEGRGVHRDPRLERNVSHQGIGNLGKRRESGTEKAVTRRRENC